MVPEVILIKFSAPSPVAVLPAAGGAETIAKSMPVNDSSIIFDNLYPYHKGYT
jgi:hypothetical protein